MALTTVTVHGKILDPDGLAPAVGTITFNTLIELRDLVANVVYTPASFTATLNGTGEFTLVLPATDNADLDPASWVYQVYINTATWESTQYVQIPFQVGTVEYADLTLLNYDPCTGVLLATPIGPNDAALFVRKTGDTMTGSLAINADLTVTGNATVGGTLTGTYQGISGDVMRLLSSTIATGGTSGGTISINANPALIDISATTGWVVNYDSTSAIGPGNPSITYVNFPGQTALAPLGTLATYWLLDSTGTVVKQSTPPTLPQMRTHIFAGASVQVGGIILGIRNLPMDQSQPGMQLFDLMSSLGAFNVRTNSNVISPNGVNKNINTTGGDMFIRGYGINAGTYLNPHVATLAAQTPATFRYATATNLLAPFVNTIDVANYDPSGLGVVTPIGGGANTSSIHRVFIAGAPAVNEQITIQYGQNTYSSLANARAAIGSGTYIVNPLFTGTLTGWIIATKGATNLSDPTQATFVRAGKFAAP